MTLSPEAAAARLRGDELFRQLVTAAVSTDDATFDYVAEEVMREICNDERDASTLAGFIVASGRFGGVLVQLAAVAEGLPVDDVLRTAIAAWRRLALRETD